ncbi:XrtA/PEP-CTERM system TPR-repeat protein PrsT [Alteromonas gilva]|uniref:PEP-CTERM system TPR-repeat protein PrsT n=1 Tax=Alteromonas gilva TaxID=2987522 RepID=A0ABT5L7P1_9ALTE|nr:XrtA/PEP-CTERM system TPR-repeat protein PrsT [Alteromonas gilva]MDC8833073.1 PEP-CTERM system TPR-repeat protein PrsT [Alteromonas gilva]
MNKKSFNPRTLAGAVLVTVCCFTISGCSKKTSDEHILAARQFSQAGDLQAAVIEYKSAVQKAPDDPQARFELAKTYLESKDYAAAEKEFNRALELGYAAAEVIPYLSRSYHETDSELALADIDHNDSNLTSVERAEVSYYKLEALVSLEKKEAAKALLSDIADIDTTSAYKGLALALGSILDEDYEGALARVNEVHKQAPLNKDVLLQQARLNWFLKNTDDAITAYDNYLDVAPDDAETKFIFSAILVETKRFKQALPLVDDLLQYNENNPLLNQFKGLIEVSENQYQKALTHFEKAILNNNSDQLSRLMAGFSAYQLKDFATATQHLSMVATALPSSHPALRMLADSLLQQGENEEASVVLDMVDGEVDNDVLLFSKAGYQLLQSGNVVGAQKMVNKTVPLATSAQELTRLGVLQLSLNDAAGLVNLEAAVEKAPELSTGQQTLANAYLATRQFDKALDTATKWQQAEPKSALPWLTIAKIHLAQKQLDQAEQAISEAEKFTENNLQVQLQKVALEMAREQSDKALEALNTALQIDPLNQTSLALLYVIHSQLQTQQKATDYIQNVIKENPDSAVPKVVLARIYLGEQKFKQGLDVLAKVDAENDAPTIYWDTKGRLLLANKQFSQAEDHYQKWLAQQPTNKAATMSLAMLLDMQGQFRAGEELISAFLEKNPDVQAEVVKAYFHAMLREPEKAEKILSKLSPEARNIPFVKGIDARLQIAKQDYESALPNALAAYQAMPNVRGLALAMLSYDNTGQTEKGFALLKEFVDENPDNNQALLMYAERLIARDVTKSISVYETIIQAQPGNAIALNNLAFLEFEQGLLDKAEAHARQAMKIAPTSVDIVDTLGQILIAKGQMKNAKSAYDTVIADDIQSDEIYLNYVELLLKMDMKELASRRITEREFTSTQSQERLAQLQSTFSL